MSTQQVLTRSSAGGGVRADTDEPATKTEADAPLSDWQALRWMLGFLRPVVGVVVLACVYLTLWVGAEVLANRQAGETVNFLQQWMMGQGNTDLNVAHVSQTARSEGFWAWISSNEGDAVHLRELILLLTGIVCAYGVLRYLREVSNTKMSMHLVYYIREAVYDKLQRVGFGFHDSISTGQLITRALSDLQNVRAFLQTAVLTTLEIVLVVLLNIVLILTRSPWLALLSLVPLPIWTWYILRFSKKVQPVAKSVMEAEDKNVSIITEAIAGVHVVKAFAAQGQEIGKYSSSCDTFKDRVLNRIRMFANFQPVIRSIATASHLSLFVMASILMIKGKLAAGDLLILGGAMGAILGRLQAVATINEQYQSAMVSARRLHEVLAARPTVPEKADARALPEKEDWRGEGVESPSPRPSPRDGERGKVAAPHPALSPEYGGEGKSTGMHDAPLGAVKFEDVCFGYDPKKAVLKNICFEARAGSVVAIVGPTGAGKSSLVNLIARFYDPQQGRIRIDGMDVRDATLTSVRTQVALVFQETYLFSDTVAANIAYGRPGITEGEIEAAARLAQAHEFIETMPQGYQTVLAERGASLSGGQRQRLAIARAIVTNPRILVLDDATAAVDPETEDLIRRAMRVVMKDRTTFIIAHRISSVRRADLVIVLEHGRITQMGTHDELMAQEGHYREIAAAQLALGEDEAQEEEHPSHMRRVQDDRKVQAIAEAARGSSEQAGVSEMLDKETN